MTDIVDLRLSERLDIELDERGDLATIEDGPAIVQSAVINTLQASDSAYPPVNTPQRRERLRGEIQKRLRDNDFVDSAVVNITDAVADEVTIEAFVDGADGYTYTLP